MGQFKINGVAFKNPSTFKVERYNVTTLERLANAKMVGDLVAKKKKFYFTYKALTSMELDNIINIIMNASSLFMTLTYPYNGGVETATVYVGSIPADLHRGDGLSWIWKGVSFDLIEQ